MGKRKSSGEQDMAEFEAALLRSLDQAQRGEGRVTTAEELRSRRSGRPLGSVKANPKVSTTIRLSPEVMQAFRASGDGWQTRIDAALKDWLRTHSPG